ncbi:hypothetical protein L195_g028585, partial [Trifolium pratense]
GMDRSWMRANRLIAKYEQGVMEFLQFSEINLPTPENTILESDVGEVETSVNCSLSDMPCNAETT